ncbi:MAG: acyl-ACP--UDP-N-acetylglucosamine O-acyltransferase [Nitrospirae bacterium]|nr:MAG: acyl-ACP--UDP-N-acetylglucosamine O-acyltransferase [Nitrospirota bacterium]
MAKIHPTAIVEPGAELADGVEVGPYAVIGPEVRIGEGTVVGPHCVIQGDTVIGAHNRFHQSVSVGDVPQDLKFGGEPSRVRIGDHNVVREFVTIHKGTKGDRMETTVGDHNLIMVGAHLAHDVVVGNHCILANLVTLAGHVHVDDYAIVGGLSAVHQFVRIGAHAMVGGASAVANDVPPFLTVLGNRAIAQGLNLVGLRRRKFPRETINAIRDAFEILYRSDLPQSEALERVRQEIPDLPEIRTFLEFVGNSTRGIVRCVDCV